MFKDLIKFMFFFVIGMFVVYLMLGWVGVLDIAWMKTIGLQTKNTEREVFKASNPYVESVAGDLSKYKYQYDTAKTDEDRQIIVNYILTQYPNFNANKIENLSLRNFLLAIQNNTIQ